MEDESHAAHKKAPLRFSLSPRERVVALSDRVREVKKEARKFPSGLIKLIPGGVLLSHTVSRAVPSGLRGLTAVFGMGTGGTPSLKPPRKSRTKFSKESGSQTDRIETHLKYFMVKPHDRLVRVSFTPYSASTPRLSTWSSPTGLQGVAPGITHLVEGFPLICFQRLSF